MNRTERRLSCQAGTAPVMPSTFSRRNSLLLLVAVWSVPALLSCGETYLFNALDGHPASWARILIMVLPGWYLWAALTPFVFVLSKRFPLTRGALRRSLPVHLAACAFCAVVHGLVYTISSRLTASVPYKWSFAAHWGRTILAWLPIMSLLYWAILGVAQWLEGIRREQRREREQAVLATQLAQAELNALRMQLHPHFLFNTLNTIAVLIRERDTAVAVRLVTQLGDILRQMLRGSRSHETSLRQEIAFVRTYLDIEQVRFDRALAVRWVVPNDVLSATIPVLILQPLVENALRHGIAYREDGGSIEIGARRDGDGLTLWVSDNGPGPAADDVDLLSSTADDGGVGLANTRKRLAQLYPKRASFRLVREADGGARAEARIPFVTWQSSVEAMATAPAVSLAGVSR